ncbi:PLP-dependent transferase [Wallemia mellicola]|nr:PLP-dependent transferase [Wallemia mellicola]
MIGKTDILTQSNHADQSLAISTDVAPPIHTSTTFRFPDNPDELIPVADLEEPQLGSTDPAPFVYSREFAPNATRLEAILSSICKGHALVYASGLAAFHALLVRLNPKILALPLGKGYHGIHEVAHVHQRIAGTKIVDSFDTSTWDEVGLGKGDVIHIESPINPSGESYDIAYWANLAHARGALLTIDSTLGPPGLQNPFEQGADFVMHSGTKYVGGHSDLLCGILVTQASTDGWKVWHQLQQERLALGNVIGNLESWLGVRSLRTMDLRVKRQSQTASELVNWLAHDNNDSNVIRKVLEKVQHSSLQAEDKEWLEKQMPGGFPTIFIIWMKSEAIAKALPSKLRYFQHATSLGGVESLIEWRTLSDDRIDRRILRISCGIEHVEDLKSDLLRAFQSFL